LGTSLLNFYISRQAGINIRVDANSPVFNHLPLSPALSHLSPVLEQDEKETMSIPSNMPAEDLQAYQLHLKSFTDEYHPKGATEANLVQSLADTSWRLNRVAALETNLLTLGLESQLKALSYLSMHSQRLSRQFERTITQLRDLQKIRRIKEKNDLDNLIEITQLYESKGKTYDPSADGFVFSQQQIDARTRARNHERRLVM
jgi:hypothetical protein